MTPPLRLGIVGVGVLTLRAVLPHLTQADIADRLRVTALADPAMDRARAAAAHYGIPGVHPGIEAMLAADDVDAVTIVSPIGLHFAHAKAALLAGKHVHLNKTMTTTLAEADALIALAAARGLRIVASPGEGLRPQVQAIRRALRAGAIGTVAFGTCGVAFGDYHETEAERTLAAQPIDPGWYFRRPGGGPMYDMGSYALHQVTAILGPARAVTALSGIRIAARAFAGRRVATEMDDNTGLLLDFGEALFVFCHATAAGAINPQFGATTFHGTKGTLDGILLNGTPLDFPGQEATRDAPVHDWEAQCRTLPHVTGPHRTIPEPHVFEDVMQLVRWVREGIPSAATAEHARHVVEIIEAGYRAAETGQRQTLRTTFALPE